MAKLNFIFYISLFAVYSLVSAQSLPKQRQEKSNSGHEQIWKSKDLSSKKGFNFQRTPTINNRNELENIIEIPEGNAASVNIRHPHEDGNTDSKVHEASNNLGQNKFRGGNVDLKVNGTVQKSRRNGPDNGNTNSQVDAPLQKIRQNELKERQTYFEVHAQKEDSEVKDENTYFKENYSTKNGKAHMSEDENVSSREDALVQNKIRHDSNDRNVILGKDHPKASFKIGSKRNKGQRMPKSRSLNGKLISVRDRSKAHWLDARKRLPLQNLRHWFSRRYGYFDSLASSIFRK